MKRAILVIFCLLNLTVYSYADTVIDNIATVSTTVSEGLVKLAVEEGCTNISDKENIFPDKMAETVIVKSTDSSEIINHLSNTILVITAIILLMTVAAVILPLFSFYNLRRDLKETQSQVYDKLRYEFESNIVSILKDKIEKKAEYHSALMKIQLEEQLKIQLKKQNTLLKKHMDQQSASHEEILFYAEKVHLELLNIAPQKVSIQPKKGDDIEQWMQKQQQDTVNSLHQWTQQQQIYYQALLQLISPDENDTYTGLGIFQELKELPESFLQLLRFLKEQGRLPGETQEIARKLVKAKFGEDTEL